ncbi:Uncharacterised protein [Mycobacteroides abscessus subsp. abscessus]|nr:Uncharacterised protein [Mycobacteroides abscessus subsp. abscessus]
MSAAPLSNSIRRMGQDYQEDSGSIVLDRDDVMEAAQFVEARSRELNRRLA